ncbi:MAG: hypothetical protein LH660_18180 [Phormidesmis sp. CAN_BIN36]|nr:hypothetical protein [Phormidesmis sp. CAN_BIN36]
MNCKICPHPHPLPKGEGTRILAPFSLGRRAGEGFAPLREEGVFILRFSNAKIVIERLALHQSLDRD